MGLIAGSFAVWPLHAGLTMAGFACTLLSLATSTSVVLLVVEDDVQALKLVVWRHVLENIGHYVKHPYAHFILKRGLGIPQDVNQEWAEISQKMLCEVLTTDGKPKSNLQAKCTCSVSPCICYVASREETLQKMMKAYSKA